MTTKEFFACYWAPVLTSVLCAANVVAFLLSPNCFSVGAAVFIGGMTVFNVKNGHSIRRSRSSIRRSEALIAEMRARRLP